jgi:hypothetical protein
VRAYSNRPAAVGVERSFQLHGEVDEDADAELRVCQDLIRGGIRLSEAALADDRVDLRSLNPAPL